MVVLSASAIASIYAAGFALTRAADAGLSGASSTSAGTPALVTPASATTAPTPVIGASSSVATATTAYKDGTYTGQGTSRRGGVSVSVSVQGGAITNVQITSASTEYPVSRIASLPSSVVKQQTANVNVITGATYSSQAFKQAIQQALTVAQAAPTTVAA
jgi:uncharacterized protein with FMN-binding domain